MDREELDPYAEKIITLVSLRMVGRHGFTNDDKEDIKQELWTVILINAGRFDGDFFSQPRLVKAAINNAARDIARNRAALKNYAGYRATSFDSLVNSGWDIDDNGAWETLMDMILDGDITLPEG